MVETVGAEKGERTAMTRRRTLVLPLVVMASLLALTALSAVSRPAETVSVAIVKLPQTAYGEISPATRQVVHSAVTDDVRVVLVSSNTPPGLAASRAVQSIAAADPWEKLARELGVWIVTVRAAAKTDVRRLVAVNGHGDRVEAQQKTPSTDKLLDAVARGDVWAPPAIFDEAGVRFGLTWGSDLSVEVPALAARGAQVVLVVGSWSTSDRQVVTQQLRELSRRHAIQLVVAPVSGDRRVGVSAESFGPNGLHQTGTVGRSVRWIPLEMTGRRPSSPAALGLPAVPRPSAQTESEAMVELGRQLFLDKSLSSDGKVSCATCHDPEQSFTVHQPVATGVFARKTKRNVPTLLNVAFRSALFWDGYASSLENQTKYPLSHPQEMDTPYLDQAVDKLAANDAYRSAFSAAFDGGPPTAERAALALAAFQRSLVAADSRVDRFLYAGDVMALSASEQRGLALFREKAGCAACHVIGHRHALFSDQAFHDTGVGYDVETASAKDGGLGWLTDSRRVGQFLTPSLRNVADTAPYMHDGSLDTLEAVVDYYAAGGKLHQGLDPRIVPLDLAPQERIDLVAFLRALSSERQFDASARPVKRDWRIEKRRDQRTEIAAIRITPIPLDVNTNRAELGNAIAEAARRGAEVVVLQEYAETGRLDGDSITTDLLRQIADEQQSRGLSLYAQWARRHRVWISVPLLERVPKQPEAVRQSISLIDPSGRRVLSQPKVVVRKERGDGRLVAGDSRELRAVDTPLGWIAPLAGDDLQTGVKRLAELGAQVVLVSASWGPEDTVDWAQAALMLSQRHRVSLVISDLPTATLLSPLATTVGEQGEVSSVVAGSRERVASIHLPRLDAAASVSVPLGLPSIPAPMASPVTQQAIDLGKQLFLDRGLSRGRSLACVDCHMPERGFTDGLKVPEGFAGRLGPRNTPTLLNAVYRPFEFWDGRESSLEEQVLHAVQHFAEMDSSAEQVLTYVRGTPAYRRAFERVTGNDTIEFSDVARAIAAFERTLVSGNSPFDRWFYRADATALAPAAQRGFRLFVGEAGCSSCHHIGEKSALFTDHQFHNTGIGYHARFDYLGYNGNGLGANTPERRVFRGEYMTPTLRNAALTGPYMHDGSLTTLEDVVEFYARGGVDNPTLDPLIKPLTGLSARDKRDLVEFLRALTSSDPLPQLRQPDARLAERRQR